MRLVVVLGYSGRRALGPHPIAAARVERGLAEAREGDLVVLSGTPREAEWMAWAWGEHSPVVSDPEATRTVDSAAVAARLVASEGAEAVVVVTSWWHLPRALLLFRALLAGRRTRLSGVAAAGPWSGALLAREAALVPFVPLQIALAWSRRRGRSRRPDR